MLTTRRFNDRNFAASIIGDIYGGTARTHPERVLRLLGDDMRPASRIGYLHQLLAGAGWTSLPGLPFIRQQTLLLAGDDDPVVPAINSRIMSRLLPHATLHIYHGGHVELVTDTQQLAPLVTSFLTSDH
jgi:pimeloyl-ACP methyl ester carboxylesterase